ncbi:MAG: glycosyltransferase family 2 protein [bacterium]
MTQKPITVIVPIYKNVSVTHECIQALLKAEVSCDFNVLLINDASPEPGMDELLLEFSQLDNVQVLTQHQNQGFTASVNLGMKSCSGDVVLLNSDTRVSDGWLDLLIKHLHKNSVASVTPLSNNATICSYPKFLKDNPMPDANEQLRINKVASKVNAGVSVEIPTAVGFCMAISRSAINQCGYFDEQNFRRGYGEENDFSRRVVKSGLKNVFALDVYVAHQGGVSFLDEASALQKAHGKRLLELHPEYDDVVQEHIKLDPAKIYREQLQNALQL